MIFTLGKSMSSAAMMGLGIKTYLSVKRHLGTHLASNETAMPY